MQLNDTCDLEAGKIKVYYHVGRKLEEARQPTPVFLPGEPHGQRSLENPMDRGAWWATVYKGHKESDMTEQLNIHAQRCS